MCHNVTRIFAETWNGYVEHWSWLSRDTIDEIILFVPVVERIYTKLGISDFKGTRDRSKGKGFAFLTFQRFYLDSTSSSARHR